MQKVKATIKKNQVYDAVEILKAADVDKERKEEEEKQREEEKKKKSEERKRKREEVEEEKAWKKQAREV